LGFSLADEMSTFTRVANSGSGPLSLLSSAAYRQCCAISKAADDSCELYTGIRQRINVVNNTNRHSGTCDAVSRHTISPLSRIRSSSQLVSRSAEIIGLSQQRRHLTVTSTMHSRQSDEINPECADPHIGIIPCPGLLRDPDHRPDWDHHEADHSRTLPKLQIYIPDFNEPENFVDICPEFFSAVLATHARTDTQKIQTDRRDNVTLVTLIRHFSSSSTAELKRCFQL